MDPDSNWRDAAVTGAGIIINNQDRDHVLLEYFGQSCVIDGIKLNYFQPLWWRALTPEQHGVTLSHVHHWLHDQRWKQTNSAKSLPLPPPIISTRGSLRPQHLDDVTSLERQL